MTTNQSNYKESETNDDSRKSEQNQEEQIELEAKKDRNDDKSNHKDMNNNDNDNDSKKNIEDPSTLVPQLDGVSYGDLQTAIRVLSAVSELHPKKKRKKQHNSNQQKQQTNDNKNPNNGNNNKSNNTKHSMDDGLEQYKQPNLRSLRKALAGCLDLHQRTMFEGKSEKEHFEHRQNLRSLKRQKMAERDHQKKYIADTALRKGRIEKLHQKQLEAQEEEHAKLQLMMIPDGHVDTLSTTAKLLENGTTISGTTTTTTNASEAATNNSTSTDANDANSTTTTHTNDNKNVESETPNITLPKLRSCYVCKNRFRELHQFYDQLCPPCAKLNWMKRHQTANLVGKVAVVTGSRVKIGLQTCLKLLRAGATVVATTRFPNTSVDTYRKQHDFNTWKDRLFVYGLDLRDVTGLEAFCRFLKQKFSSVDILINNAAQTIRRPRAYYIPITEQEQTLWQNADDIHKSLLSSCVEFEQVRRQLFLNNYNPSDNNSHPALGNDNNEETSQQQGGGLLLLGNNPNPSPIDSSKFVSSSNETSNTTDTTTKSSDALVATQSKGTNGTTTAPFEKTGVSHSTAMSQMVLVPEDVGVSDSILPPGVTDINGQQLDLRKTNSWLLKMEEVTTPEVMECMFINAIAPFVLNSRLKPLMTRSNNSNDDNYIERPDRYIINVSAMEGKFYRYKMPNHPHTNMAKAALNMLTRTSAEELAKKHRIYMNSVDTGWINDENPLERANRTAKQNIFQTPIDEIDAAARILDPIFTGVQQDMEAEQETKHNEKEDGKQQQEVENHEKCKKGGKNTKKKERKTKDYGKFLKDYRETEW